MLIIDPTRSQREMYDSCAPDYLDGEEDDRESREYDRADAELHRRYDKGE